ncbi:MAG: bifunctional NADP-dependent methylenetetrahydromethanopterin dehydrogenase/methylenetetrahydrofolate dehydrogenase [Planctomycetales bacterium]|nr:bifunctional NADP-dependent methylenetetrahydromethanopterin dehydrogenase/methylenetetrahydrofolate dehydrogenase [Planctomycetales bacterium]
MAKRKILIQLDPDEHASVFDAVVAVDAGVEHLLQNHSVRPEQVRDLVHGAMFTRSPQDLSSTAVFIGGSNVAKGEELLKQVTKCFFGPMRVSVLLDANGANTTAAASVLAAAKHVELKGATATILAGTGPVGQRAARLLVWQGATVRLASRTISKAEETCQAIRNRLPGAHLQAVATATPEETAAAVTGAQIVISAGAAGIQLISAAMLKQTTSLKVAIDLNAVPPLGIEGIEVMDKAKERGGILCYGAIGVGGTKMKIHRAAIERLFTRNDLVLDAEEVFALGQELAK